jgi:L-ascorbate metabolism protein UlaG (beta-lactamase superfamily)
MEIRLLRHATCLISYNGKKMLVDPVLSPAGAIPAIPGVPNTANNPLTTLPGNINIRELMLNIDAVLITHTHRDHFDDEAMQRLPKEIPVFCQPSDVDKIKAAGFLKTHSVTLSVTWDDITFYRTTGQHGTGDIGHKMGPVSGFILKTNNEPTLYITGDTVWCPEVEQALQDHQPQVIICFAGAAQFHEGDPITMTASDIANLAWNAPQAKIAVVHMEAWNHCRLSRKDLNVFLQEKSLKHRVYIPENGDNLYFRIP